MGAWIDDLKSLSSYRTLVCSVTGREESRPFRSPAPSSLPLLFSPREFHGEGGQDKASIRKLHMVLEVSRSPSNYAVEKGVQYASHTCYVYGLPSESTQSTNSSVVMKPTGPTKVSITGVAAGAATTGLGARQQPGLQARDRATQQCQEQPARAQEDEEPAWLRQNN